MEFTPRTVKNAIKIRFIEGNLDRFDGKTLSVGFGPKDKAPLTRRKFILLSRKVIALAKQNKVSAIEMSFKDLRGLVPKDVDDFTVGEVAGCAFVMADYEHNTYKTK